MLSYLKLEEPSQKLLLKGLSSGVMSMTQVFFLSCRWSSTQKNLFFFFLEWEEYWLNEYLFEEVDILVFGLQYILLVFSCSVFD